ncbi:hypothetical protein K8T06_10780 [bacterium]|nr:hypothetical protein [bacterium]
MSDINVRNLLLFVAKTYKINWNVKINPELYDIERTTTWDAEEKTLHIYPLDSRGNSCCAIEITP